MNLFEEREKIVDNAKKILAAAITGQNPVALRVTLESLSSLQLAESEAVALLSPLSQIVFGCVRLEHTNMLYAWVHGLNVRNGWKLEVAKQWLSMDRWVVDGIRGKNDYE